MSTGSKDSGTLADLTAHASGPERGSDRTFGIVFTILFLIIGCWPLLKDGPVRVWALGVAGIFLALAIAVPKALAPLNRLWMAFGLLLGRIISPIMLFLVYLVAVVPTGLIMRAMGKDPLHRRLDRAAKSYWVHRVPPGKPDATMTRQF
jgi:hypothetical protein